MTVCFDKDALVESQNNRENPIGVESDPASTSGKISEAEKIVGVVKKQIAEGGSAVGVSASNSGRGRDLVPVDIESGDASFTPTALEGSLEEEPLEIGDEIEPASDKPATEPDPSKQASSKET